MSPASRAKTPGGCDAAPISRARIERLRDSLAGKDAALAELIDLFLGDLPRRIAAITAAAEQADAAALALHAHALRSGAGNFGASVLDRVCEQLEQDARRGALGDARAALAELVSQSERVRRALLATRPTI